EDGSIILSMETSGWWDVKRWVLSHGREAKVLEPEELRREMLDELRAAQDSYSLPCG
ncbi:MAG: WYL domain-containing protein, partial [Calditrichaeota bacterium]|nr:WYL domain-containing protein [Calditrichota bacterium]